MYKYINRFLQEILPFALLVSIITGSLLTIALGYSIIKPFALGVALSFFYFILLTISTYIVVNFNTSKAKNMHTVFFIIRYMTIAVAVYIYASKDFYNVIFVIIGITMVLFSIKINAFVKHYKQRKESKNGGSKSCI